MDDLARLALARDIEVEQRTLRLRAPEPLARDLEDHKGRCVVIPGPYQPARVHALAHQINRALGGQGEDRARTAYHTEPIEARPPGEADGLGEGDWIALDYDLPEVAMRSGLSQYELLTGLGDRFDRYWILAG